MSNLDWPYRTEDDGSKTYLTGDGRPIGIEGQQHLERLDRYLQALADNPEGSSVKIPQAIQADFMGPSVEDALVAQTGTLQFLQDVLAMDGRQSESLTESGVHGLFCILTKLIENNVSITAYLQALNKQGESCEQH